ncbi:TonB-dependent receptor family protein [Fluviicola taffensis]|uniref:TonB-dependent receptor n=1 Tax=Fluviicola taffensis (strain DSM 16823 / NCIMB 13979 / RW262) TaxID=755732 RepID=F2IGX1_FLUTR|nr:TonB-dependent receptor [Fluviicola taffensis]AEA44752.1 TonB-dependent receptor [Fluviicola taffensis DSM 16823]
MDYSSQKLSLLILFSILVSCSWSQNFEGTIVDQTNTPQFGVTVQCNEKKVLTDESGKFQIPCEKGPLIIYGIEIDTLFYILNGIVAPNPIIQVKTSEEIDEVEVKSKRLHYFDIGFIPPIKGVQIATGTNTLIETERQGGAKSTANPRELFAKVPGLNIWESDGAGIQMGVGGRGLSPNRAANFNTRQNGYDISADALGYPESYYTPPLEALQAIEIIRGSASLQYGTQFGGLMNFILKDPIQTSPLQFTTRNSVGNYGYFGTFNRISGTVGRFQYQAYYQLKTGKGYRPNSNFNQQQGFAQIGYIINENNQIRLEYTRMSYLAHQPGGLTDKQFEEDPTQSIRDRNWFKVGWNILALHFDSKLNSKTHLNVRAFGMLSSRYSLGYLGKINTADPGGNRDLITGNFKNTGIEARVLRRYKLTKKQKHESAFLIGARYYRGQTTNLQGSSTSGDGPDFEFNNPSNIENSDYSFPSENIAVFTDNIWFLGNRWTINAGLRFEHIMSSSKGYYYQYNIHPLTFDTLSVFKNENASSLTRNIPLIGAGTSFKTGKFSNAYINFCQNYRAVNFSDIRVANPNIVVDSLIKDEYGNTTEIGWRGFIGKYFYSDIAVFALFYGNKIGLAPQPNSVKKIRTNIGNAFNTGVECFVEFDFIKAFMDSSRIGSSIFVNFSYIDAHYISSREKSYVGKQVEYVSPLMFKTGLKVRGKNWQAQIQGSYNSSQFSDATNSKEGSGDAVIGEIPAYFVMDFSARYTFRKYFQLEAGVNNLLNSSYYTRRATAYPGPGILPSDGITIYGTLQFTIAVKK